MTFLQSCLPKSLDTFLCGVTGSCAPQPQSLLMAFGSSLS